MIVNEIQGNLFDELIAGDSIAHGANCVGVMGAGVAKPIRDLFPVNYKRYRGSCQKGLFVPGDVLYTQELGIGIYNLGTQFQPGANAKLEYIQHSARKMATLALMQDHDKIKTVRMGSGIGGLNWDDVKAVLEAIVSPISLEVYCL